MKTGILRGGLIVVCAFALFSSAAALEVINPTNLKLRITKVEPMNTTVSCYTLSKGKAYLRPKAGWNGYIVSLKGSIPKHGVLIIDPASFYAVYEDLMRPGKLRMSHASAVCASAFVGKQAFVYAKDKTYLQKVFDPGPFNTRVLFYLPKAVTKIRISTPGYIAGEVKLDNKQ